jgi:hypothetical protein
LGTAKTTIELNGKRYDARTGQIIGEASQATTPPPAHKTPNGAVLDGFTRRPAATQAPRPKPSVSKANINPAQRQLQKSKTLMRPAVKKPAVTLKNDVQPLKKTVKPTDAQIARQSRATYHHKSPMISKFRHTATSGVTKKHAELPVKAATVTPAVKTPEAQIAERLRNLEHAVQNGTAHLQQLEKNTVRRASFLQRVGFRNRAANLATMCLAVLLLGGFFAYQNLAAIEMRVAATRSGVSSAKLPGYKPAGYGVAGSVKSEPGKVSVSFVSRTDSSKNFTVKQQASNWTSSSLLANHVTRTNKPYQTYQNDGKTVYIYNNSNATWVDKGVWYQVEGNASLSSDQLLRLSNSF